MNDELDDRRLRRAVRGALDDIVATSPTAADPPNGRRARRPDSPRRGPWLHIAAGLTAAAGLLGIVVVASRDDDTPAAGEGTDVATTASAPGATTPETEPTSSAAITTSSPSGTTMPAVPGSIPAAGQCGTATVPDDAASSQAIAGDIDGDAVDDTVTLYALDGEWRVHVTSSVTDTASDTAIELTLDDAIDTATVSFADIDSPAAIMVTAHGENDRGIDANFTFLTLDREYCVDQWIYRNAQALDEPFEWVALREPGHVTGLICEGTTPPRRYRLVDSEQNADGSWRVVNRILTHDFTRAEIEFPGEDTVRDSPDFATQYGSIVDCD